MIVVFRTRQLERCYKEYRKAVKAYGEDTGKRYIVRINTIKQTKDIEKLMKLPVLRCHAGQYAVNITGFYRLIFSLKGEMLEIVHILLHDKHHTFLEDGLGDPNWKKQEEDADEFAQKTLIPPTLYRAFVKTGHFTATNITSFSDKIDIAPGIIVGRLQHDGLIPLSHHIHRTRYKWAG